MKTIKRERLTHDFAVFNCHINNASARADAEYVAQFGQKAFDKHIAPLHKAGIMSIFNDKPSMYTMSWVVLVTAYVNEPLNKKLTDQGFKAA